MEVELKYQELKKSSQITVGDIIRCEAFAYGIAYPKTSKEIFVGWIESNYKGHLQEGQRRGIAVDAYEPLRGKALFLVLSMELMQSILPEDIWTEEETHYIGINVKCIRLTPDEKLSRNSERIFFTLHHSMSCIDLSERNIEIVEHLDLPIYWHEDIDYDKNDVEKPF